MHCGPDKNSYKSISRNINNALIQEFLELSSTANAPFLTIKEEDLEEVK
jgi:hypothetical protein